MRQAAAAFPASAATLYFHDIQFGIIDALFDGFAHLDILSLAKADIAIPVANNNRSSEFDPPSGVGHSLYHVNIQNLIL
ncbi:Uncharacterised protein [uncultured archaeon]|nr:Uncharacterised protein [uncultured archaeon]